MSKQNMNIKQIRKHVSANGSMTKYLETTKKLSTQLF